MKSYDVLETEKHHNEDFLLLLLLLQGYIWMAHRSPSSVSWDLASWSTGEWRRLIAEGDGELRDQVEWQDTGR